MGQKQEERLRRVLGVDEFSSAETDGRVSSGKIYAAGFPVLFSDREVFCWGVKNNFRGQICSKGVGSTATAEDQPGPQFDKKLAHLMEVAGFNHSERVVLMQVFSYQLEKNLNEMKVPFCTLVRAFMEKTGTYPIQFLGAFKGEQGVFNPNKAPKPDQFFYPVTAVIVPHGDGVKVTDIDQLRLLAHSGDVQRENFDPTESDPDWRGIWCGKNLENIERSMTPSHIDPFKKSLEVMKIHFKELQENAGDAKRYEYYNTRVKLLQKLLS